MKTTFALLTLAAVSLVAAPQTPAPTSQPTPASTTQPKKEKRNRTGKADKKKPETQKSNAPKN